MEPILELAAIAYRLSANKVLNHDLESSKWLLRFGDAVRKYARRRLPLSESEVLRAWQNLTPDLQQDIATALRDKGLLARLALPEPESIATRTNREPMF
jgi:hypothetical protein